MKVEQTPTLYKLLLSSKSGYVTIPLFKRIMEHFTKWWNESFPGLDCFLVCDNLPVHVNSSITKFTDSKGVHIKTIMPGSSHWFQVHDQHPFGILKNKIAAKMNKVSRVSLVPPETRREMMMGIFSLVSSKSVASPNVLKSFEEVGLWPWDPQKIIFLCRNHYPPPSQLKTTPRLRSLERIMDQIAAEQAAKRDKYVSEGKRFIARSSEDDGRYNLRPRKTKSPQLSEDQTRKKKSPKDTKGTQFQPPAKRSRKT